MAHKWICVKYVMCIGCHSHGGVTSCSLIAFKTISQILLPLFVTFTGNIIGDI